MAGEKEEFGREEGCKEITFFDRLLSERKELDDKIKKLLDFLGLGYPKEVDTTNRFLLRVQLKSMITYKECLDSRIKHFNMINLLTKEEPQPTSEH